MTPHGLAYTIDLWDYMMSKEEPTFTELLATLQELTGRPVVIRQTAMTYHIKCIIDGLPYEIGMTSNNIDSAEEIRYTVLTHAVAYVTKWHAK